MTTSVSPNHVNPNAVIFKITASDVEWMMNSHGFQFDRMDPHAWAKARNAISTKMSAVWQEVCADAIADALK
jgi:hypothetical protein